jgi:hypothetical protein
MRPTSTQKGAHSWAAMLCLLLSMAAVFAALQASEESARLQGPSALQPLDDGTVWLVVDEQLLHLDATGRQLTAIEKGRLGLGHMPGSLALRQRVGELYALPRGTDTVSVLSAQTGLPLRTIKLAWPKDMTRHMDHGLWLAVNDDGRMAVSSGGGHAVCLFTPDGALVARSRAGTFRFTNELFWVAGDLWTTDTNGQAMVRLSGADLSELERKRLPTLASHAYLALAQAHPSMNVGGGPMFTLGRMGPNMSQGSVTFSHADHREQVLPLPTSAEPRSLKWRREELLVVDGADWRIKRYTLKGEALEDFGDEAFRRDLASKLALRHEWSEQHKMLTAAAVLSLVAALVLVARHRFLALKAARQASAEELRFVGTPVDAPSSILAKQILGTLPAWLCLLGLCVLAGSAGIHEALPELHPQQLSWIMASGAALALTGLAIMPGWLRVVSRKPEFESMLNAQAMAWLRTTPQWAQEARPGEHVRETWTMRQGWTTRWLILTNRRLLVFSAPPGHQEALRRWYRASILNAALLEPAQLSWLQRLKPGGLLRMEMGDGTTIEGHVPSSVTARRVVTHLSLVAAGPRRGVSDKRSGATHKARALWQVSAALLVPGLGQWWQRRQAPALLLFVCWLGWGVLQVQPVVWAWWQVTTEVSPGQLMAVLAPMLGLHLASMLDASAHPPPR